MHIAPFLSFHNYFHAYSKDRNSSGALFWDRSLLGTLKYSIRCMWRT